MVQLSSLGTEMDLFGNLFLLNPGFNEDVPASFKQNPTRLTHRSLIYLAAHREGYRVEGYIGLPNHFAYEYPTITLSIRS